MGTGGVDSDMSGSDEKPAWGILEIAVLACTLSALIFLAVPSPIHDPATSPATACINNMRQIDGAANEFALEHSLTNGDPIRFPDDLTNYIKLNRYGKIPPCPSHPVVFIH